MMLPWLGTRNENLLIEKKDSVVVPQLSNEMQLSLMMRVKSGELTVDDALDLAGRDHLERMKQSLASEEQQLFQYNFSVYKYNRYRWQKRILQIDFNTKMVCSIEKGIVKRQLHFLCIKSCDDGVGSKFSISFRGRHDYELEATSPEDKQKIMLLVDKIIYKNIYDNPVEVREETSELPQPETPKSLKEGLLFLQRGGLASFKWVKYEASLHPGQLSLLPCSTAPLLPSSPRAVAPDGDMDNPSTVPVVVHFSDGDASVERLRSCDTFTLFTHKNEYQFRIPVSNYSKSTDAVQKERDSWVQAIDELCVDWRRRSQHIYEDPRAITIYDHIKYIAEENKSTGLRKAVPAPDADHLLVGENTEDTPPPSRVAVPSRPVKLPENVPISGPAWSPASGLEPGPARGSDPIPARSPASVLEPARGPDPIPAWSPASVLEPARGLDPIPVPTSVTFPLRGTLHTVPVSGPGSVSTSSLVLNTLSFPVPATVSVQVTSVKPAPPFVPMAPPLPFKLNSKCPTTRTKAFHWDEVSRDKIEKSFWLQTNPGEIQIDTSRLNKQFAVQDLGTFGGTTEPSNNLHIMLNPKVAHNFNIFLKGFPVQPGELKDKLFLLNESEGGFSDEQITSLRRYVPTPSDVEMYTSCTRPVSELHIVDRYMMELCNIPYLSARLDLLLTLRELPISMEDLQPLMNQKIRMCTQLYSSRLFVSVLELTLAIGNYLNENAGKEKAKGFRLSTLTKLSQIGGSDRKFTLLHALVEQIMLHKPILATFPQELAEFETVPGASIKGLTAEVDVLKNELQKVIQYRKTYKRRNQGNQDQKFSKDLKMAIEKYSTDLTQLTKRCEEMKKLYTDILVKFGEPKDQDSQELFGFVCQFINNFKKTHSENRHVCET